MQRNLSPQERQRRSDQMKGLVLSRMTPEQREAKEKADRDAALEVERRSIIRRFGLGDLPRLGLWLVGRLQERFPHLSDRMIAGWLRGEIDSNESLFLLSPHCVALAKIRLAPMDPQPLIEEVFVLEMEGGADEGPLMYKEFARWAKNMNAAGVIVDRFTDVSTQRIADAIGLIRDSRISIVRFK